MELKQIITDTPISVRNQFKTKHYDKGDIIIFPNEPNSLLYILTNGMAEVYRQSAQGNMITLSLYEASSIFGEMELFNDRIKTATVVAKTKCTTIIVSKKILFQWMQIDPRLSLYVIEQLTEKLDASTASLVKLSLLNIKDRIVCSIYSHYKMGDLHQLTKPLLSSEVCAPIRSINRSLAMCIDEGLIAYDNKTFTLPDKEKLINYAEPLLFN